MGKLPPGSVSRKPSTEANETAHMRLKTSMSSTLTPPQIRKAQSASQRARVGERHPDHLLADHRVDRRRGGGAGDDLAGFPLRGEADGERHQERHEPDDREEDQRRDDVHASSSSTSVPVKSLGWRKSTGLPCAPTRPSVAENAGPRGQKPVAGGGDVGDLVAEVVDAARRVLGEEGGDRRGLSQRVQQLDLGVGELDEDDGDPVVGLVLRRADAGAEGVAVLRRRGGEVGHGDGDVVEAADHARRTRPFPVARQGGGKVVREKTVGIRGTSAPHSRRRRPVVDSAHRRRSGSDEVWEDAMPKVSMTVNGRPVSGEVEGRTLLVEFLREGLRLTGTHVGCDTGQCGACVVHVDGVSVKSCNVFALDLEGAEVRTIEGMANPDGSLGVIQAAFQTHHGLQCGFCTPGMVMTAAALLKENAEPERGGDPRLSRGQHLPLHRLPQHRQGDPGGGGRAEARPGRGGIGREGGHHAQGPRDRRAAEAPRGRALPDRQGPLHRRHQPARPGLCRTSCARTWRTGRSPGSTPAAPRRCRACSGSSPARTSRARAACPAPGR